MFRNYLKTAWRNLIRKKGFSAINIIGLSIGMAAVILIALWVQNESSYDRFYKDSDRLYQVWNRFAMEGKVNSWSTTPKVMAKFIQNDYPEIEVTTRVNWPFPVLLEHGDKKLKINGNVVDSSFLNVFSFPLLKGDRANVLMDPHSIVLTESAARRFFNDEDPMGKVIRVDNRENYTITGILKDLPNNTSFEFEWLLPWAALRSVGGDDEQWGNNSTSTYVLLKKDASLATLAPKLKGLRDKYQHDEGKGQRTFLYPFSRNHLHGLFENGKEVGGRIEVVRLFSVIALLILLIACINFMNLSTARSEKRAREVGIRKVVGAQRGMLVLQFMGESVLIAAIAGAIALIIVKFTLPPFNDLVGKKLSLSLLDARVWIGGAGFILVTGLLAGSYPSLYLSSFRPVKVLKGTIRAANALVTPRKILVISQFTIAIVLIIATIIVRLQLKNAQDRQSGYNKNNLIYVFMEGDLYEKYNPLKSELLNSGVAYSVTKTSSPITQGWSNSWGMEWKGKDPNDRTIVNRFCVDDAIVKTAGLKVALGRDFDLSQYPTDSTGVLINETAVKLMGFKTPIGEIIKDNGIDWHVIGVVKDFILNSPYEPMQPTVMVGAKGWYNVIHIRYADDANIATSLKATESIFKKFNPNYPFEYTFADLNYAKKFANEQRTSKLATLFALLTIAISCLGLFGLSSYMAENRIKEVGVRKVLGASVTSIVQLLSREFLKMVLIAFLIASPIAYLAMSSWLQDFPYRVAIQWWVFASAGLMALLIAMVTVSAQFVKAAVSNPVKSLRSE